MFVRRLLVALGSVAMISAIAAPASAAPSAPTKIVDGIFDITSLDAEHQALVEEVLACDDFNWSMLKETLKKKTGRTAIKVRVSDISKWGAVGLSWRTGLLEIDDQVLDPRWFQQVFMHEIGHMVDFYYLMPNKLHGKVSKIYGAPWSTMGHDFNGGFTNAFSCVDGGDGNGRLDDTKVLEIRALLGGDALVPAKTL